MQNEDRPDAFQTRAQLESVDAGHRFGNLRRGPIPPDFTVKLRSGVQLSYQFVPRAVSATSVAITTHRSTDDGQTWSPAFDVVADTGPRGGSVGRVSGTVLELSDGTVLMPYYLRAAGDAGIFRAVVLASTDGGMSFALRGTIAVPPAGLSISEPSVVVLPNGTLLAVVRTQRDRALLPLTASRSNDGGRTWTPPTPVLVSFPGRLPAPRVGINPQLVLLPNGVLVLSSGRPNNFVAASVSGAGDTWHGVETYVNHSMQATFHGSSGNTGLAWVESNRAVQLGDNCANSWGCPANETGWTIDAQNRVWRRFIEVTTPHSGKIDVYSKLLAGTASITTTMVWHGTAHPRAVPAGAFDGSTAYWSSAFGSAPTGVLTLKLDRPYLLNRIGLSLHAGQWEAGRLLTSSDGVTFRPLLAVPRRRDYAMRYADFTPRVVRYVRAVLDSAIGCHAHLGASCTALNELELYSTVDSFENDAVGSAPRDFTTATLARVVDWGAVRTRRSALLSDSSTTATAQLSRTTAPARSRTLDFSVRPYLMSTGFAFTMHARTRSGTPVAGYHFLVSSGGFLHRYDTTAGRWVRLGSTPVVSVGASTAFRVSASPTAARMWLSGRGLAAIPPSTAGVASFDGFTIASTGRAPTGCMIAVDDVDFR